jgi:hypothetical protein
VIVGAIAPCGQCFYCLDGVHSQRRGALGGWRLEHHQRRVGGVPVGPDAAHANLATIPAGLADEDVLL